MRRLFAVVVGATLALSACDGGGGGTAADEVEAYCEAVRFVQELEQEVEGGPELAPDASREDAFAAMQQSFERLRGRVEELRDAAPGEIRDEVGQMVDAVLELIDAFVEMDDPNDLATSQAALARIGELQDEVADAQERVGEFTEEHCGIDLGRSEPGDDPPPGDPTVDTAGETTDATPADE